MGESRQPSRASAIVTFATVGIVLLLTAAPPVAHAVKIEAGPTTVFFDTFEGYTPGSQPAWSSSTATTLVTNAPVPGPAEGAQYLGLDRPVGPAFQQTVAQVDFGAVSSGALTASFRVFIPATAPNDVLQMSLTPNSPPGNADIFGAPVWLTTSGNDVHTYTGPPAQTDTLTGVTFVKGAWQTWKVIYTFNPSTNDDTFTVSVDGMTSAPINAGGYSNVGDPANLRYLNFRVGDVGTFYLDAVPEPGSVAIVGLAAAVAAGGRRLRRRLPNAWSA